MAQDSTCSHDHDCGELDCGSDWTLYKHVDLPKVRALNEAIEGSCKSLFRSWELRLDYSQICESNDEDPELILFIPFTSDVKIKSISIIGGPEGTSPARMRAFINREDLDFSTIHDRTPVQEWTLGENLQGELEYLTKYARFQGVYSLTLHFPENFGASTTRLHYVNLRGEATDYNRHAVAHTVYEAMPNPQDHKLPDIPGNLFGTASDSVL